MNCKHCNAPLEYLSKRQASKLAQVNEKTIFMWIKRGILEPVEVKGAKVLKIKKEELEKVIENGSWSFHKCRERRAVR